MRVDQERATRAAWRRTACGPEMSGAGLRMPRNTGVCRRCAFQPPSFTAVAALMRPLSLNMAAPVVLPRPGSRCCHVSADILRREGVRRYRPAQGDA